MILLDPPIILPLSDDQRAKSKNPLQRFVIAHLYARKKK